MGGSATPDCPITMGQALGDVADVAMVHALPWLVLAGIALVVVGRVLHRHLYLRGGEQHAPDSHLARTTEQQGTVGIYHALHETTTMLAHVVQRLDALEGHAQHNREVQTLMLERLSTRSRTTRKTVRDE